MFFGTFLILISMIYINKTKGVFKMSKAEKKERIKDLYYHLEYSDEFFKSDKDEEIFRRIDIKIEELMGLLYGVFK